ncbi:hypothetical protein BDW59DRAFT_158937 [Aspergillus cavernicola]|uniref:Carbohydrate kinase FGGY C-terminal domain-containing protein n=1 Tax=Aspergillus cavernicola TaxID=176166 RepID=A0ABR4IPS4_9EURO
MTTEPGAAVNEVLRTTEPAFRVGDSVLMCDRWWGGGGGGTVDIATFGITNVHPHMRWQSIASAQGGLCAGIAVDSWFYGLMVERFGEAFIQAELKHKGPRSFFMRDFEEVKRAFGPHSGEPRGLRLNLDPDLLPAHAHQYYGDREVYLTHEDLRKCFEQVANAIADLIETQLTVARQQCGAVINRIVLVEGFSQSPYIRTVINNKFHHSPMLAVTSPTTAQEAVVRGRVHIGMLVRALQREVYSIRAPSWCSSP